MTMDSVNLKLLICHVVVSNDSGAIIQKTCERVICQSYYFVRRLFSLYNLLAGRKTHFASLDVMNVRENNNIKAGTLLF